MKALRTHVNTTQHDQKIHYRFQIWPLLFAGLTDSPVIANRGG
jgi:hypothetical protein